ncbi:uncharacterized protein LOC143298543 [Babylonia areolata]|uniref:uncharacterized protein LOC143298543 n=1 Tax=Babylonia areolata TaxID=304850 RepID=UPI003FD0E354
MGGSESKGEVVSVKPPEEARPGPPYPGPEAKYKFMDTNVVISSKVTFSFMSSPMLTSNIDNYYPLLAAQYAEGYRLLSFYRIPGQQQLQGFFSTSMALGFQGIFCRYPAAPRRESWQLRIEKSTIQLAAQYNGIIAFNPSVVTDSSHLLESITRNALGGGRLICIEMTGGQQAGSMRQAMRGLSPLMGVDLFYEIPDTPGAMQYVYNVVSVPIRLTVRMGFRPSPVAHCDWMGVLADSLSKGWRLIEIFMDKGILARKGGFQASLNSLWFFEKPAYCRDDPTPIYEGTVITHEIKIKTTSFGSTSTTTRWEPVISDMGSKGWELACILELPEYRMTGIATAYMVCKLFFQRPILPTSRVEASAPSDLPPPYDIAVRMPAVGWRQGGELAEGGYHPPPATVEPFPPAPEKMGH